MNRSVVDAVHRVLDVAVRGEDERGDRRPGKQALEVLGGERVQPAEAVGAGDPHDTPVRQVDEAVPGLQCPLLAGERAVVRRDRGVQVVAGHGPRKAEQRAVVDGHDVSVRHNDGRSRRW
jgi:hypothetical protein